jgi:hypothetical protein
MGAALEFRRKLMLGLLPLSHGSIRGDGFWELLGSDSIIEVPKRKGGKIDEGRYLRDMHFGRLPRCKHIRYG